MRFAYGAYLHPDNECWFSLDKRVLRGKTGRRTSVRERWTITGVKKAATTAALTTELLVLEAAYSRDLQNLILLQSDGTPSRHGLFNSETLNGVQVKAFDYLPGNPGVWGSGTEYVRRRTFRIVIEGERLDLEENVVSYNETVQQIGNGGQKFIMVGSLIGPVQKQILQEHTPFMAIQSGSAVGFLDYPIPPPPLFATSLHNERQRGAVGSPIQYSRLRNSNYRVTWYYPSESAAALIGGPVITL
jgi:hypothetical protein